MKPTVDVVAALILKGGRFLACQRPATKARGLLWEFVGGKVEQGETKEEALMRECMEELALPVKPYNIYAELTHEYPDLTVHLTLFEATCEGEPTKLEHNDIRWITPFEIGNYEFCPADKEILERLQFEYAKKTIPVGRWKHYKGNEYTVIGIAKHSETLLPMVVYRACYGDGTLWVRPAEMWNETVEKDGKTYRRFTFIGEN